MSLLSTFVVKGFFLGRIECAKKNCTEGRYVVVNFWFNVYDFSPVTEGSYTRGFL